MTEGPQHVRGDQAEEQGQGAPREEGGRKGPHEEQGQWEWALPAEWGGDRDWEGPRGAGEGVAAPPTPPLTLK